jgi:hypothetical protein
VESLFVFAFQTSKLSLVANWTRKRLGLIGDPGVGVYCCSREIARSELDGAPTHEVRQHAVEMCALQSVSCLEFAGVMYEELALRSADGRLVSRCVVPQALEPTQRNDARGRYWYEMVRAWRSSPAQLDARQVFQSEPEQVLRRARFYEAMTAQVVTIPLDSLPWGVPYALPCCWVIPGDCLV